MDKQTLSNYGWLVIVTLILAVLLAMATPFGTYVGDAVVSVANGFVGTANSATDEDNISSLEKDWTDKLNGTYSKGVPVIAIDNNLSKDKDKPTIIDKSTLSLSGTVTSTKGITSFLVNDASVTVTDTIWNKTLTLTKNVVTEIKFEATSGSGDTVTETRYVKYMNCMEIYFNSNHADMLGITSTTEECFIPAEFENDGTYYKVKGFAWNVTNYNYPKLKKLTIDDDYTGTIGTSMFQNNDIIETVILSKNTSGIETSAFTNCTNLKKIEINWENINTLSGNSFSYSPNIEFGEIKFNNTITSIPGSAFAGCKKITKVTLGNNITSIGNSAFSNCESIREFIFNNKVETIGTFALNGCYSLNNITLPNTLKSIGQNAFFNCKSFTNIVLPNSVETLGYEAFGQCSSLSSIQLSNSLKEIQGYTFSRCSALTEITVPEGVTSIKKWAFADCYLLKIAYLPSTLTSIDSYPFIGLTNLEKVVYNGTISKWDSVTKDGYWLRNDTGRNVIFQCSDTSITLADMENL